MVEEDNEEWRNQEEIEYGDEISLSEGLSLPQEFITEVNLFVGVRKNGKSYAVGVMEEGFLEASWPFIVIDPMGIHYVLREHYEEVMIIGGPHGDAEITVENILCAVSTGLHIVFDLSQYTQADQWFICTKIMDTVKMLNKEPLNIIVEESDIFIPQKGGDPSCKAAITWLVRKGRMYGVGMTFICQRLQGFQSIDKDVLSQVDNYFVFKLDAPSDQPALRQIVSKEDALAIAKYTPGDCFMRSSYYEGKVRIKERLNEHAGVTPKLGQPNVDVKLKELFSPIQEFIDLNMNKGPGSNDGLLKKAVKWMSGD